MLAAIFGSISRAIALFQRRQPVPRSSFISAETGAPLAEETGEALTIE